MKIESRFAHQLPKAKKNLAVKPQHSKCQEAKKFNTKPDSANSAYRNIALILPQVRCTEVGLWVISV